MADDNLQTNQNMASVPVSAPATPVVASPPSPAATPAPTVVPSTTDDVLDLDSIYDLDADTATTKAQAALSANAPVPTASLDSFRAQSGAAVADGAVDNKVLADLAAMAKKPAMPVAPIEPVSDVKPVEDRVSDPNWLEKISTAVTTENKKVDDGVVAPNPNFDFNKGSDISRIEIEQASAGSSMSKIQDQVDETKVSDDAINAKKLDKVDLDIDAAKLDYSTPAPGVSFKEIPAKPSISEAAKIEADLEANTIDLDAELKGDGDLPDLFESAAPAVVISPASAPTAETVDDLGASRLSKIKLTKTMGGEDKRVATVQKLMKTDTIYNRADKKELNLSSVSGDKKLKSPSEELAELTLEDWSRLGDIPSERADKIKEKIASLGAKSIIDEVKGLNAWRSSQTHQAYLDLGVAAMLSEKSLEEIVGDQKDLNLEEWLTINQLNRELMI